MMQDISVIQAKARMMYHVASAVIDLSRGGVDGVDKLAAHERRRPGPTVAGPFRNPLHSLLTAVDIS